MQRLRPRVRKVIALIRVSSPGQKEDWRTGIDRQKDYIQRWCQQYGLEIIDTVNIVISGKDVQNDPDFKRMLSRLSDPKIDGVVCATLDRFFRPDMDLGFKPFVLTVDPFVITKKLLICDEGELDPCQQCQGS